jgi:transposase
MLQCDTSNLSTAINCLPWARVNVARGDRRVKEAWRRGVTVEHHSEPSRQAALVARVEALLIDRADHLPLVISPSRRVRRTTIGCGRFFSAHCFQRRCYSRIADTMRTGSGSLARQQGAWANISAETQPQNPICFSPYLYRACNLIERFFNKIKQCRRIATRYDKLAANYPAFVKLASIRIWPRATP